jgi:serine/threonine protein phosphatase PrpC
MLIISSDGLFNVFTKDSVGRKVLRLRKAGLSTGDISDTICEYAVNQGCKDNVTVIIVEL